MHAGTHRQRPRGSRGSAWRSSGTQGRANHGHVGRRHHGGDLDRSVFGVGGHVSLFLIGRCPLMSTGWALRQRPCFVVFEQHVEVAVVPLGGVGPVSYTHLTLPTICSV